MSIFKKTVAVALSVGLMSSAVYANAGLATISNVSGKVLVNSGEGFVPATPEMVLKAGDRVLVGEESSALVSYKDCAVVLDKPAVVAIPEVAACDAATIQPVADVYVPSATPAFGIPPIVLLTAVGITAVTCVVACKEIFGDNDSGVSGP